MQYRMILIILLLITGESKIAYASIKNHTNTYAYILNYNKWNVSVCDIQSDGSFANCRNTLGYVNSTNLVVNSTLTKAYITQLYKGILECDIQCDQLVGPCQNTNTQSIGSAWGILLNDKNAYLSSLKQNTVYQCDKNFKTCTATGSHFKLPSFLAFNPTADKVYVPNLYSNNVTACNIMDNGNLNCNEASGTHLFKPFSIAISPHYAYVTNYDETFDPIVSKCTLDAKGNVDQCEDSLGTFNNATRLGQIAISSDFKFAYVTAYDAGVFNCEINNTNGNLSNCKNVGSDFNSPYGIYLY